MTGNQGNDADFRFALRGWVPGDLEFVLDSWRRSYEDGRYTRCPGGLPEYIATQRKVIVSALRSSEVVVAHPEAPERVPGQILGWCCYRGGVVHYVYVKPSYRRAGIGRALLEAAGATRTQRVWTSHHWHRPADKGEGIAAVMERARRAGIAVEYNPALIFGGT